MELLASEVLRKWKLSVYKFQSLKLDRNVLFAIFSDNRYVLFAELSLQMPHDEMQVIPET